MKLVKGDRVVVSIRDPKSYACGAAAALNDKVGTVVETTWKVANSFEGERFLVEFDTPAPKWWNNQTPATSFHFPGHDLKRC